MCVWPQPLCWLYRIRFFVFFLVCPQVIKAIIHHGTRCSSWVWEYPRKDKKKERKKHNMYCVGIFVKHYNKLQEVRNKTNGSKMRAPVYIFQALLYIFECLLVTRSCWDSAYVCMFFFLIILMVGCAPHPYLFCFFMHLARILVTSLCVSPCVCARVLEKRHCVSSSVPSLSWSLITVLGFQGFTPSISLFKPH